MRIDLWSSVSSNGQRPFIETVLLEPGVPRPLVLICPGGGYTHFGRYEGMAVAQKFNSLGFHAAILEYRIQPTHFPEPALDLLRAIKIVRKNAQEWGVIPHQIAALGFSAGGHLALSAAVYHDKLEIPAEDEADQLSGRPDALILCYSAISTKASYGNPGIARILSGGETEEAVLNAVSLDEFADASLPPTFLWQTATDSTVNYRNSVDFAEKLWRAGVKASLHIFPEGPHGKGLAEDFPDLKQWPELAAQFLKTSCGFNA